MLPSFEDARVGFFGGGRGMRGDGRGRRRGTRGRAVAARGRRWCAQRGQRGGRAQIYAARCARRAPRRRSGPKGWCKGAAPCSPGTRTGFEPPASRTQAHGLGGCHLPFPCGFWFFCCCVCPPSFFFFFFPFPFCLSSPAVCLCCESTAKVVRCRGERNPPGLITLGLIKPFASFQSNKQTSR